MVQITIFVGNVWSGQKLKNRLIFRWWKLEFQTSAMDSVTELLIERWIEFVDSNKFRWELITDFWIPQILQWVPLQMFEFQKFHNGIHYVVFWIPQKTCGNPLQIWLIPNWALAFKMVFQRVGPPIFLPPVFCCFFLCCGAVLSFVFAAIPGFFPSGVLLPAEPLLMTVSKKTQFVGLVFALTFGVFWMVSGIVFGMLLGSFLGSFLGRTFEVFWGRFGIGAVVRDPTNLYNGTPWARCHSGPGVPYDDCSDLGAMLPSLCANYLTNVTFWIVF